MKVMILWEGDDSLVGGRTGQNGENREQQQRAEAVALPLRAARIADCAALPYGSASAASRGPNSTRATSINQASIRHQSGMSLQQSRYRTV